MEQDRGQALALYAVTGNEEEHRPSARRLQVFHSTTQRIYTTHCNISAIPFATKHRQKHLLLNARLCDGQALQGVAALAHVVRRVKKEETFAVYLHSSVVVPVGNQFMSCDKAVMRDWACSFQHTSQPTQQRHIQSNVYKPSP